ncbi:MAG: DUF3021 domain-containing protein [Oscillospiraceae bacterium]
MKKNYKPLLFAATGFIGGTFIATLITILISLTTSLSGENPWQYLPMVPGFEAAVGNQLGAFALQFFLSGLLGAGFAAASLIFETERWSFAFQSLLHFVVLAGIMLPIAWVTRWMEHSLGGVLGYLLIFVAIYFVIWLCYSLPTRRKIERMNRALKENNNKENR